MRDPSAPWRSLGVVWVVCAVSGPAVRARRGRRLHDGRQPGGRRGRPGARRHRRTGRPSRSEIADDDFRDVPGKRLLTGLRGKDVLLVFVESYGRVAVQDSDFSPGDRRRARRRHRPAAGGGVLLAQRVPHLTDVRRGQLAGALHAAVGAVGRQPAALQPARPGRPDHPHQRVPSGPAGGPCSTYPRSRTTGRRARRSTASTSSTTSRTSRTPARSSATPTCPTSTPSTPSAGSSWRPRDRQPVMAEIDLESSHHPWAPLPRMVDWHELGDGSVFDGMPEEGESAEEVFRDPDDVRNAYGESIEYSLNTPDLVRGDLSATRTWSSSSSATTSRTPTSPATTPATTSRSPSSPTTRPCWTGSPAGAGRTASTPPPTPRSGRWTPSATASSTAYGPPAG